MNQEKLGSGAASCASHPVGKAESIQARPFEELFLIQG